MKKAFIQKKDYDFYRIPLPLSVIRSKKRRSYVHRELEKRHPQFSAAFATDMHLTLHRFRPAAEITVMDSSVLADYHRRFPGRSLLLEGKKHYPVFFSGLSKRKTLLSLILFACIGVFMTTVTLKKKALSPKLLPLWKPSAEVPKESRSLSGSAPAETEDIFFSDPSHLAQEITESLLDNVEKSHGYLRSFSWENDLLSLSLRACSPESIASTLVTSVSYEKNRPAFTVQLSAPRTERVSLVSSRPATASELDFLCREFIPLLRREILSNRGEVKSEQLTAKGVTVSFSVPLASLSKMLWSCSYQTALASLAGFSVWESGLSVSLASDADGRAALIQTSWQVCPASLSPSERESSVMNALSKYASLFTPEERAEPVRKITARKAEKPVASALQKIGEIRDGSNHLVYFKSASDGKIIVEKMSLKEAVNE